VHRPLQQLHISIPASEYTKRFNGEGELIVRVGYHATFIENTLDGFLQPLPIFLLSTHDEFQTPLNNCSIWVVSFQEPNADPSGHDNLGAAGMLNVL
jgi:hypothetical protein